ncbi:MAG TPA: heme ABC transporter permease [Micropepsaceae bacterium]|jgi:heme exporter protein C|nr:heme ABC transporter permease [Micropepsaceae bacterium]
MRITVLANPKRFLDLSRALIPWIAALAFLLLAVGIYWALFQTPPDYQQGQTVKIMFVHVPAAYMGLMIYGVMAGSSLVGLVFRHPLADVAAKSAAPLGAAFTALALLTGSLWGRPMWGTYWQWGDARLVSELILFFIYMGYIALWNAIDEPQRAAKAAAILSLVGAADLPIIHFSVEWWNTLHQGPSIGLTGSTIDPAFLWPLFVMMAGYTMLFAWLWLIRMQTEIFERRARALMLAKGA